MIRPLLLTVKLAVTLLSEEKSKPLPAPPALPVDRIVTVQGQVVSEVGAPMMVLVTVTPEIVLEQEVAQLVVVGFLCSCIIPSSIPESAPASACLLCEFRKAAKFSVIIPLNIALIPSTRIDTNARVIIIAVCPD